MLVCDCDPRGGLALTIAATVPGVNTARYRANDGSGEASVYFYDRRGSWSLVEYAPGAADYEAYQFGPRDLCAEIVAAVAAWEHAGRPRRDRLGLSVTATGEHRLWADTPLDTLGTP